jgi:hypothetical protein
LCRHPLLLLLLLLSSSWCLLTLGSSDTLWWHPAGLCWRAPAEAVQGRCAGAAEHPLQQLVMHL